MSETADPQELTSACTDVSNEVGIMLNALHTEILKTAL